MAFSINETRRGHAVLGSFVEADNKLVVSLNRLGDLLLKCFNGQIHRSNFRFLLLCFGSRSEERGSDSNHSRSLFNRYLKIAAHTHAEMRKWCA